ncbi:MAG TPA: IclR family transcriptional regulator [Polyangiales bacterium]|jgi:IclR family acetate operon transcriptional repressor|nr:IclR family transcriptional regulator [Polyangiales bacterium]
MENVLLALSVLESIATTGPIGVSALAREMRAPKTTVHRSLQTLHTAGWIRSLEQSTEHGRQRLWTVSPKLLSLCQRAGHPRLRETALPIMEELRTKTKETIHLMVPQDRVVVLIERLDSPQPLRIVRPLGGRSLLHVASNGKAVLAHLSAKEQDAYLSRPLKAITQRTITDSNALRLELERVRRNGYAACLGELDEGVHAVAAPILVTGGRPIGSLSISCPALRLPEDRVARYGALVRRAADQIGLLMLASP